MFYLQNNDIKIDYITLYNFKVQENEFIDDYERPVLEKYEKISPTPLEKKKKVQQYAFNNIATLLALVTILHLTKFCFRKLKNSLLRLPDLTLKIYFYIVRKKHNRKRKFPQLRLSGNVNQLKTKINLR